MEARVGEHKYVPTVVDGRVRRRILGNPIATAKDFRYLVVSGKNGNIGRNSFYNPGRQDWTMAIQREFKLPTHHMEQQSFSVRMETFNPFNHPNLGGGENGVPSVNGSILSANFMNTAITQVGGRSVRFWGKYTF
jgi:hypothetical protein